MREDIGIAMRLKSLIIKEFIAIWQDKRGRMALIVPPLIQFFVFTFAATLDVHNISIGIKNNDYGQFSRELIHQINGSEDFTEIVMLENDNELRNALDTQKVLIAIEIKDDFSKKILSGEPGNVNIIADGRKSNASQIAVGYVSDIAQKLNRRILKNADPASIPSELKPRNWYNANLNYTWFTITGLIGILSMLTSISVTALSIAREKEMGTYEQLIVSPLTPSMILAGKAIPALIIGVLEGSAMLLAGYLFLDLPIRGNLLYLYPSMIIFILAIVGIGLFISSLSSTQQQAALGVFLCITPIIITSGFATPVENMPRWLQYGAMLNPLKFFLVIVRGICLKGISGTTIFHNTWPMLLIAFGTLGTSSWFFKRKI